MAELDGLDATLRDALARAARPADPTGVADAIRSRVAAGDPGTSVAGPTAPGWSGGVRGWLPWLGLLVAAGIVGGAALGVSGALGEPTEEIVAGYTVVLDDATPAAACPAGAVIDELRAGDRVLAIARSEDSGWLGVRDPDDFARALWVPRSVVVLDAGQPDVATLPVGACPETTVALGEPTAAPTPTDEPAPGPQPGPGPAPGDTTAPIILSATGAPNPLYNVDPLLLRVTASDNVGVQTVLISWSGEFTGSGSMSLVGSEWRHTFVPPDDDGGTITFTFRARDAAGNLSTPVSVIIDHQYFG